MSPYKQFTVPCQSCGSLTSKSYARQHNGNCKQCTTGEPRKVSKANLCPDCGIYELSAYQRAHRYHCDSCTRNADPIGYANEVRFGDSGGDY